MIVSGCAGRIKMIGEADTSILHFTFCILHSTGAVECGKITVEKSKFSKNKICLWKREKFSTMGCGDRPLVPAGFDPVFHIEIYYYCYY